MPCSVTTRCALAFLVAPAADGPDVETFFIDWASGESSADVSCDGGVDGMDVEAFFRAWEAGGC